MQLCLSLDHHAGRQVNRLTFLDEVRELARIADSAGFDSIWVTEDPDGWDAFALLGAIAVETDSVRLGTGVVNPYMRHPNLIASSTATIDRLSHGRAFVGIGRGTPELFRETFGMDTGTSLERTENTISLLRQWWQDDQTASCHENPAVRSWKRTFKPIGSPPVYIAAAGPKALSLAGRLADGVLFNRLATPTYLEWAIERVKRSASAANRNPDALVFFANPALQVTDDPAAAFEREKAFVAMIHSLPGMDRMLESGTFDTKSIMNSVREVMKTTEILNRGGHFADMREEGDLAAAKSLIPSELIDEASAIGSENHVVERLNMYARIGVTHVFAGHRGLSNQADALQRVVLKVQ